MLVTAWCNQLRWHQCSSGSPAIIPLKTRYWNRPVGGDDAHDCVSRSNRKWQLKRSEDGKLVGFVFVDVNTSNIDGYVRKASQQLSQNIQYPPGYYIQWAGQFQYLQAAKERLKVVVPFTLLIIFVLIYINTRSLVKTGIVLLAVPFSLVGAVWLLWLLGYNMSVAVWVGLIALAGLDAETGVVMLLYLDHAWEKFRAEGRMRNMRDLHA